MKIEVLTIIDDKNKIYYTEEKSFASNSEEALKIFEEYTTMLLIAREKGYRVIKINTLVEEKVKEKIYTK